MRKILSMFVGILSLFFVGMFVYAENDSLIASNGSGEVIEADNEVEQAQIWLGSSAKILDSLVPIFKEKDERIQNNVRNLIEEFKKSKDEYTKYIGIYFGALIATDDVEMTGKNKIYYQGHASLRITTAEGKVIYVDPYYGENYDVPADLVLVTHGHPDHNKVEKVVNRNDDFQVITYTGAIISGEHQSFDLGYVKVQAVEAGYNPNHDRNNCVGYVLEFSDGTKVYIAGDTSTTPQMKELGEWNLDYAFLPCDGKFNMGVEEASEAAKLVNAKHTIPYHMFSGKAFDEETVNKFDVENKLIVRPDTEIEL